MRRLKMHKGSRDDNGLRLIPVTNNPHRDLPKMSDNVPPPTFYAVDERDRLVHMVTMTDRGLAVAWDTCAQCTRTVRQCACRFGVAAPGAIRHIFQADGGYLPDPKDHSRTPLPPALALREPIVTFRRKKTAAPEPSKRRMVFDPPPKRRMT